VLLYLLLTVLSTDLCVIVFIANSAQYFVLLYLLLTVLSTDLCLTVFIANSAQY